MVVLPTCRGPRSTVIGARPLSKLLSTGWNAHLRRPGSSAIVSPRHHGLLSRNVASKPCESNANKVWSRTIILLSALLSGWAKLLDDGDFFHLYLLLQLVQQVQRLNRREMIQVRFLQPVDNLL